MSLNAMNGTMCQEGEVVVGHASTISFSCSYHDIAIYTWYLDDIRLAQFNSSTADIAVVLGVHTVKCSALIDGSADRNCSDSRTINVTALSMTLSVPNQSQASCERGTRCADSATYEITDPEVEP